MERRLIVVIILLIVSVTTVGMVAYYALQPSEHYHPLLLYQWEPPPMTNTTTPFTTTGKQWYIEWTFATYHLVSSSLDVSVRKASNDALVEKVTLTSQQPKHYFNEQGTFYLTIMVNNATNLEGEQLVLVDVWG
ncbi:MAG: hypothetical protein ABR962_00315 [Candidatus Bathyarchaeia archaeon]